MNVIDPELLRTFVAFVDTGSLSRAAAIVGRSPSAVTAQMHRLDAVVGQSLLSRDGRGRVLTPAGDQLLVHARRILDLNREVWLSLKGAATGGTVVLGTTQDFADHMLPGLLRVFSRTHGGVRLDLRIGRTIELSRAFEDGEIDCLIAMRMAPAAGEIGVVREPMLWMAAAEGLATSQNELPLALLDPPCGFRAAALAALDGAHRPYRIAVTSATLSGLRCAVLGGVAVTLRSKRWLGDGIIEAPAAMALPDTPHAEFSIRINRNVGPAAKVLADLLCDALDAALSKAR
jgi:DNA-binding transcriptional LysR family regulator